LRREIHSARGGAELARPLPLLPWGEGMTGGPLLFKIEAPLYAATGAALEGNIWRCNVLQLAGHLLASKAESGDGASGIFAGRTEWQKAPSR
jgi:hypothetical protein